MAPRPEVTRIVRNQSSRNGTKPLLIVMHDTEGANLPGIRDLQGLGDWFDNPAAQASSHAANDAEGNDARYVPDNRKAWHVAGYNSLSLGLEQIGFASQKAWPEKQLRNSAEWVAYWSKIHGIPVQRGRVANGQVIKPGVVMHSELGAIGGGHHDPGIGYPIDKVIEYARKATPAVNTDKKKRLTAARVRLKALLALRGRLHQQQAEIAARYAASDTQLSTLRTTIETLKQVIGRKP